MHGSTNDYAVARRNMVENQLRPNRITDPRVLDAMNAVPRERFVPPALRGAAYSDEDIDLGDGRWLIEPLALAKLLQAAAIERSDVMLIVGCSNGYSAAVAARLAANVVLLTASEAEASTLGILLAELGAGNVIIQVGDPRAGFPTQAPFDVILLPGAVQKVPDALPSQLGENGRLVTVIAERRAGQVTVFRKVGGAIGRVSPFDAQVPEIASLRPELRFEL